MSFCALTSTAVRERDLVQSHMADNSAGERPRDAKRELPRLIKKARELETELARINEQLVEIAAEIARLRRLRNR
jgi:septal ring factor EnvC (AmiA/AmiB activator)